MSSNKQVYDFIEGAVLAGWTYTAVEYPGVPNAALEQGESDYASLSISIGKDKAMDIGAEGASNVFTQAYGILTMRFYIRKGQGDTTFMDYQDKFYALFPWAKVNGIQFTDKESVGPHDNTKDGDWRVLSCFINFNFSRT